MKPSPLRNEDLLERRRVTIFDKDCTKSTDYAQRSFTYWVLQAQFSSEVDEKGSMRYGAEDEEDRYC
jgi:hypothetical protein